MLNILKYKLVFKYNINENTKKQSLILQVINKFKIIWFIFNTINITINSKTFFKVEDFRYVIVKQEKYKKKNKKKLERQNYC